MVSKEYQGEKLIKIGIKRMQNVSIKLLTVEYQGAFVEGRQIVDNILVMHELVRGCSRKGAKPRAILKIDIMKTYDTLSWEFLFHTMKLMQFLETFILRVKKCVAMA